MALQSTTALATVTLQAASSTVTFSGIPNTYRDLILVFDGTRTGNNNIQIRFNSDTGSNYTWVYARGNGSNAVSGAETLSFIPLAAEALALSAQLNAVAHIIDYSATNKHKTVLSRLSQAGTQAAMSANRWANTDPITTVQVFTGNADFAAGSTFSLYGRIA